MATKQAIKETQARALTDIMTVAPEISEKLGIDPPGKSIYGHDPDYKSAQQLKIFGAWLHLVNDAILAKKKAAVK